MTGRRTKPPGTCRDGARSSGDYEPGRSRMKELAFGAAALLAAAAFSGSAEAGCLKGAAVGGIAGHMVGHGVAGAAAGCAVGASRSKKRDVTSTGGVNRPTNNGGYSDVSQRRRN